ncbi:hypothetical protein F2P79_008210 [Pimephales promelas]|nr:hypothetical protein F2P79_008210 [Pimephales promelas]
MCSPLLLTFLKDQYFKALFEKHRDSCASCRGPLFGPDRNILCASCLGCDPAEAALSKGGSTKCAEMVLSPLLARLASFGADAFLHSYFADRGCQSEQRRVQSTRASLSHSETPSPVLFTQADQHPSQRAVILVSFGSDAEEEKDDCLSLAASECKVWTGSMANTAPSTQASTSKLKQLTRLSLAARQLSLAEPSPLLTKLLRHFTPWLSSRTFRPNFSTLWTSLDLTWKLSELMALHATKTTAQAIGRTMANFNSARSTPLAEFNRDEGCGRAAFLNSRFLFGKGVRGALH